MAVCEIHLSSQNALQRMASFAAIIPEKTSEPFPVLYLLHGLSDDHTVWTRRTSIERYVESLPLMVVMPSTDRGWYTDSVACPTGAYETFITRDLIGFVDSAFNTRKSRDGRALAGLSMGGYGAFKLALKHPDLFRAAASLSGALAMRGRFDSGEESWHREMRLVFGDSIADSEDVPTLIERADRSTMPALWIDCGTEDMLLSQNRFVHEHLDNLGIAHHYSEHPGDHNWGYWDARIQEALGFLCEAMEV